MRDKLKPLVFGTVLNATPALIDNVFHFHDGRVDSVVFYSDGYQLADPIADYPDVEALIAAAVPAGRYATCSAYAAIRFGERWGASAPTADVVNTNAGIRMPPEIGDVTVDCELDYDPRTLLEIAGDTLRRTADSVVSIVDGVLRKEH